MKALSEQELLRQTRERMDTYKQVQATQAQLLQRAADSGKTLQANSFLGQPEADLLACLTEMQRRIEETLKQSKQPGAEMNRTQLVVANLLGRRALSLGEYGKSSPASTTARFTPDIMGASLQSLDQLDSVDPNSQQANSDRPPFVEQDDDLQDDQSSDSSSYSSSYSSSLDSYSSYASSDSDSDDEDSDDEDDDTLDSAEKFRRASNVPTHKPPAPPKSAAPIGDECSLDSSASTSSSSSSSTSSGSGSEFVPPARLTKSPAELAAEAAAARRSSLAAAMKARPPVAMPLDGYRYIDFFDNFDLSDQSKFNPISHAEFFKSGQAECKTSTKNNVIMTSRAPAQVTVSHAFSDENGAQGQAENYQTSRDAMLQLLQTGLNKFTLDGNDPTAINKLAFLIAWSKLWKEAKIPHNFQVDVNGGSHSGTYKIIKGTLCDDQLQPASDSGITDATDVETKQLEDMSGLGRSRINTVNAVWEYNYQLHLRASQQKTLVAKSKVASAAAPGLPTLSALAKPAAPTTPAASIAIPAPEGSATGTPDGGAGGLFSTTNPAAQSAMLASKGKKLVTHGDCRSETDRTVDLGGASGMTAQPLVKGR